MGRIDLSIIWPVVGLLYFFPPDWKWLLECWSTDPPLEFFFQEQSYSSLHSGRSLAWDHDPCGAIADFCGVIDDPCGVVVIQRRSAAADAATPIVVRLAKHHKTLLNSKTT